MHVGRKSIPFIVLLTSLALAPIGIVQGMYDGNGDYYCETEWVDARETAEDEYWNSVEGINRGVNERSGSIEELNEQYVGLGGSVEIMGKEAECLYEQFGVNPNSIHKLSDKARAVLSYDMEKLMEVAPGLAKYVIGQSAPKSGCLIATAAYGSEFAPQVQMLREIRDNQLLKTSSGSAFMSAFNSFYYSWSPTVAEWERQNPTFKEAVRIAITPLITTLSILPYVSMDTEAEALGYGIGVILVNVGIYFVAPAFAFMFVRKWKRSRIAGQ